MLTSTDKVPALLARLNKRLRPKLGHGSLTWSWGTNKLKQFCQALTDLVPVESTLG